MPLCAHLTLKCYALHAIWAALLRQGGQYVLADLCLFLATLAAGETHVSYSDGNTCHLQQLRSSIGLQLCPFNGELEPTASIQCDAFVWDKDRTERAQSSQYMSHLNKILSLPSTFGGCCLGELSPAHRALVMPSKGNADMNSIGMYLEGTSRWCLVVP